MFYIHRNEEGGHFMNSTSTVRYYNEMLKHAYDLRRQQLSLHNRRGLLVADAFTGNYGRSGGHLFANVCWWEMLTVHKLCFQEIKS